MIYNNHRSGSIGTRPDKPGLPNTISEDRSGKISDTEGPEKPRSYGANQCEKIKTVNGELRIVKC